eukprot:5112680-Karenia_brevis.AAC.1
MEYSSHQFVHVSINDLRRRYYESLFERLGLKDSRAEKPSRPVGKNYFLNVRDYPFRPHALTNFPLYFFMSACVARRQRGPHSLEWAVLRDGAGFARHPFHEMVMSRTFPEFALRDENGDPFYEYSYYVHLLLHEAWRVP